MPADDSEILQGGVNAVRRIGDTVVRPVGLHSTAVHALLEHVRSNGFRGCPEVLDADDAAETLSYLHGETCNYPVIESFRSDRALVSAARLLRSYHDATLGFSLENRRWMLASEEPQEVVCHGDFAPYNCVVVDGEVVGVFDFDTAHPGPRLADVGYAAYRWVPMVAPTNSVRLGDTAEQGRRLRLFCQSYGTNDFASVVEYAQSTLRRLVDHMRSWAAAGNTSFAGHIADGHDLLYLDDIEYLAARTAELVGRA